MILIDENVGSQATVDYVVRVLSAAYGRAWELSLGKVPLVDVMTVWANALDGFSQSKNGRAAIRWALNNLPEPCPNAMAFRALCRQAPAVELPLLPEPKADPVRVAAELAKLAPIRNAEPMQDCKAWARLLARRHAQGERVSPEPLRMAQQALNLVQV
jgi:hypothetical protein